MSDEKAAPDSRVEIARLVADHWRKWAMDMNNQPMPTRLAAHPLCCVLAALDGETDSDQLGIERDSVTAVLIEEARRNVR